MLSHKNLYSDQLEDIARIDRIRKDDIKRNIEAGLFKARKTLSLNEICKIFPKNNKKEILKLIRELSNDYKTFKTALVIIEYSDLKFELKIKNQIINSIENFTQGNFLSNSEIKTLAVITYLQPSATLKNLYTKRGRSKTVNSNIEKLKKLKFIIEKEGLFILTQNFYDYFQLKGINREKIKKLLENLF